MKNYERSSGSGRLDLFQTCYLSIPDPTLAGMFSSLLNFSFGTRHHSTSLRFSCFGFLRVDLCYINIYSILFALHRDHSFLFSTSLLHRLPSHTLQSRDPTRTLLLLLMQLQTYHYHSLHRSHGPPTVFSFAHPSFSEHYC